MKISWRDFLKANPERFVVAMKSKTRWRNNLNCLGVEIDTLPNAIRDFAHTWTTEDFISFAIAAKINNRWQFEKSAGTIFQVAYHKQILETSEFQTRTGIASRKKWQKSVYSRPWIDQYLEDYPEMTNLKKVPNGLKLQLKSQGMLDYLKLKLGTKAHRLQVNEVDGKIRIEDLINNIKKNKAEIYFEIERCRIFNLFPNEILDLIELGYRLVQDPFSNEFAQLNKDEILKVLIFLGIRTHDELEASLPGFSKVLTYRGLLYQLNLTHE